MKKLVLALAVASAVAAPAAMAATYKIDAANSNVYFYVDGATQYNWNLSGLTFTTGLAGNTASLTGHMTRNGSASTYALAMVFTSPYTNVSSPNQRWSDFTGTITNLNNPLGSGTQIIRDLQAGTGADDSTFGINAAPYNANTTKLELGFWAYNSGTKRHDFNVTLTCSSGTGASGPSNPNGSCTTGGGSVPLPGTLALFGLGALGLGIRRIKLG